MSAIMNPTVEAAIKKVIRDKMDRVMDKVLRKDPFVTEKHRSSKPLYAALVPDEIFKGSHFERRFVTPFGKIWEELSVVVANDWLGKAQREAMVKGIVQEGRLTRIQEVLNDLEHKSGARKQPNFDRELAYIMAGGGEPVPVQVMCDVLVHDARSGRKLAFEIKAPLPNSDQTKVSKEKILKLRSMQPSQIDHAYFALPYNPYGEKADYKWSFPMRWFDMLNDECVLIGDEFWNMLGGDGTYDTFVRIVRDLGRHYREDIYEQYLGMRPPVDVVEFQFQSVPSGRERGNE